MRSILPLALCLVSLLLVARFVECSTTAADSWISTRKASISRHFFDEEGRVRIFHGSNRVWKGEPWYFVSQAESDDEFDLMKDMGFNVMRLGWMWSGFNPAPGVFNYTYANIQKDIVMRMNAKGIYVILDMHEDVLSSKFCLYDGAPLWVVNKSTPKHEFPWPLKGNCSSRGWMENILSEAAGTAYQDLYDNKNGMRDDLALFWEKSAEFWKDLPGVFFELINEPFAGNPYEDPLILLPGVAGRKNLMRLYDAISPSIRKVDDRHIIMYEPVTWGMIFDGKYTGTGFDHVPGGDEYANRSALSFHYYCNTFVPSYGEKPTMTKIVCDDIVKNLVFSSITKELSKIGGSALMTEGMACDTSTPQKEQECREVMSALDQHLYSWTDYGVSQGAQWTPSQAQQKAWARTFARATAGNPVNMTFDAGTGAFEYCYNVDTSIKAPTEIFASRKYYYTDGTNVRTTSNLEVVGPISDTISIKPVAGSDGGVGCVWVTQK